MASSKFSKILSIIKFHYIMCFNHGETKKQQPENPYSTVFFDSKFQPKEFIPSAITSEQEETVKEVSQAVSAKTLAEPFLESDSSTLTSDQEDTYEKETVKEVPQAVSAETLAEPFLESDITEAKAKTFNLDRVSDYSCEIAASEIINSSFEGMQEESEFEFLDALSIDSNIKDENSRVNGFFDYAEETASNLSKLINQIYEKVCNNIYNDQYGLIDLTEIGFGKLEKYEVQEYLKALLSKCQELVEDIEIWRNFRSKNLICGIFNRIITCIYTKDPNYLMFDLFTLKNYLVKDYCSIIEKGALAALGMKLFVCSPLSWNNVLYEIIGFYYKFYYAQTLNYSRKPIKIFETAPSSLQFSTNGYEAESIIWTKKSAKEFNKYWGTADSEEYSRLNDSSIINARQEICCC